MNFLCNYAECYYIRCHYVECCYADYHTECYYAECPHAECPYAECPYAEGHYTVCCCALAIILANFLQTFLLIWFLSSVPLRFRLHNYDCR